MEDAVAAPAARRLADFATSLQLGDVPADVVSAARLHLLDTLGCGLAAHGLGEAPYAASMAAEDAAGPASVIGLADGRSPAIAALANGIACHALDFDDTHGASIAHVSAVVVPAALAAAQSRDATVGELLTAVIAGNEVTCRIGGPVGDALHLRGFHPTAICGVFGATAAVGRLEGLDADVLVHALGIAGSMAAGLMAFLADGSATKRIHPGWMAHAAHHAVALARHGATGPATVLEGPNGIYQSFLDRDDLDVPTEDLGTRWETPEIAFKPYPACHLLHAAIDATAAARDQLGFEAADVDAITVFAPQAGIDVVLAPLERKHHPQTPYEAKFSAPFAIGALLTRGRVDVTTFTPEVIADPAILEVAAKVDYALHDYPTFPESFPGGVRVRLTDGREHEEHLAHQRGGPHAPLADADIVQKFHDNAAVAVSPTVAETLAQAVLHAPIDAGLAPFSALQQAARGRR
jgi:2-methylcitrate dehydratase PrpD